jgi:hypothetical protein
MGHPPCVLCGTGIKDKTKRKRASDLCDGIVCEVPQSFSPHPFLLLRCDGLAPPPLPPSPLNPSTSYRPGAPGPAK